MIGKREGLKERVELLAIGEALGFPRLGYGRSSKIPHDKRIPQGKDGWEKFCAHAHIQRVLPALRIGRILRDNQVMLYHPLSGRELTSLTNATTSAPVIVAEGLANANSGGDLLKDVVISEPTPQWRQTWMQPGTVTVYAPGKRRRYPVRKNRKKESDV